MNTIEEINSISIMLSNQCNLKKIRKKYPVKMSFTLPAVRWMSKGLPSASTTAWTLVVNPPLLRPIS